MMKVKSFTLYADNYELIDNLPEEAKAKVLVAISDYMFKDIEPSLNGMSYAIFINLKRILDKSKMKSKAGSKTKQNENKTKSKQNQNEIKTKSNEEQNKNKKETNQDVIVNVNVIVNFIENNFNRTISSYEYEQIEILVEEYSSEIVLYAFQKTLEANKTSLNYTKAILKNWKEDKLDTLEKIKSSETKKNKKTVPGWMDKEITNQELDPEDEDTFNEFLEEFRNEKK